MFFVYILKSNATQKLYIGLTNNLIRRLEEHNLGRTFWTRRYKPWRYVYIEGYVSEDDAREREERLKDFGKAYGQLKRRIKRCLNGV